MQQRSAPAGRRQVKYLMTTRFVRSHGVALAAAGGTGILAAIAGCGVAEVMDRIVAVIRWIT
jgi:hypothetical protein